MVTAAMGLVIVYIGYLERGIDKPLIIGAILYLILTVFFLLAKITNFMSISESELLISGQRDFSAFTLEIPTIRFIKRGPAFSFSKGWGSLMIIGAIGQHNVIEIHTIRESNYSGETIKRFLTDLHGKNPKIDLGPEYQRLLLGDLDVDELKSTPANSSVKDIQSEIKQKRTQNSRDK